MESNAEEKKVYTKEEVEGIVNQINANASIQCQNMGRKIQYLTEQLMYKRLDYLFKVIENSGSFEMEFVTKCSDEIELSLTIPEETESQDTTEQKQEDK